MRPQLFEVWNHLGQSRRVRGTRRQVSALCKASNVAWRKLRWIVRRIPEVKCFMSDRHERREILSSAKSYAKWMRENPEENASGR